MNQRRYCWLAFSSALSEGCSLGKNIGGREPWVRRSPLGVFFLGPSHPYPGMNLFKMSQESNKQRNSLLVTSWSLKSCLPSLFQRVLLNISFLIPSDLPLIHLISN